MKHYLFLFITICAFVCSACSENGPRSEQYALNKQELLRIRDKATQHIPITDETGIDSLYEFFKKNGTEEDAYVAAFYKAIFLQQLGDKEGTFNLLMELYEHRPSAETSESKKISIKILDYFLVQYVWDKDVDNLKRWITEAEQSGIYEDAMYYSLYNRKASYFDLLEKADSSHYYMNLAYENMVHYPDWDENKSMILTDMAGWYAQRGEHKEFIKLYELLKKHPYHGKNNATDFYAGLSYNQVGKCDSAKICFRRATKSSSEIARHAYIQLAIMARNSAQHDSVFTYLQGIVSASDSIILKQQTESTQKLEAAYKIRRQENKITQQKIFILSLTILLLAVTLLVLVGWKTIVSVRLKIEEKSKELERERMQRKELQKQLQIALKQEQEETKNLQKERLMLMDKKVFTIRNMVKDGHSKFGDGDASELSKLFINTYPKFVQRITEKYPRFKPEDLIISILVLNGFGHTDIGHLLNKERQQISNILRRISKNLTGSSIGRMDDFKVMLEEYLD